MQKIIETSPESKAILEETRRRMASRKARSAATLAAHRTLRQPQRIASREIVTDAEERSLARLEQSRQTRSIDVPASLERRLNARGRRQAGMGY